MGNSCQRRLKLFAVHELGGTGQAQGLPLQWWRGDPDSGRWSQPFQLSTTEGLTKGGVAGGVPPQKRGPKAQRQWIVDSWQRRQRLPCPGPRTGNGLVVTRGVRKFTLIFDCAQKEGFSVWPEIGVPGPGDCLNYELCRHRGGVWGTSYARARFSRRSISGSNTARIERPRNSV